MTYRYTRQGDDLVLPRAGFTGAFAATTTAASLDLSTVGNPKSDAPAGDADAGVGGPEALNPATGKGCIEHFVALEADGGDIYIITGPTQASVTGANAPSATALGANAVGACGKIPAGSLMQGRVVNGLDNWIGYVAASTATLRVWRASQ